MLASLLYPYDPDAPMLIGSWLDELEQGQHVHRYIVDGQSYLEVPNFLTHQKIDRPSKSKLPPFENPREDSTRTREHSLGIKDQGRDQDQEGTREDSSTSPKSPEPDSADARILSETVGIFGMHPQADMLRCLVSYATASGKSPPDCIEHMAARWEGYRSKPRGRFGYTSSYKFFMSGLWDEPEKWSTEEGANGGPGKSQGDGRSPTSDRVNRNLGAIAKALERRGISFPVGPGGADGAAVSSARPGAEPGGVSSGFRAVGPEILPPQSAGRTG